VTKDERLLLTYTAQAALLLLTGSPALESQKRQLREAVEKVRVANNYDDMPPA
jgi:hypothetical protein